MKRFLPLLLLAVVSLQAAENKEIKYKSRDLEKIRTEINNKKEERQRLLREAQNLAQEVKAGEAKISSMEKSLIHTKTRTFQVSQELAVTKTERDTALEQLESHRNQLGRTAKTYQVACLIGTPTGPSAVAMKQVLSVRMKDHRAIEGKTDESKRAFNQLIETQEVLRGELTKQESRLANLRSGKQNKERLLSKKRTRQEILDEEMAELQRTAQELESLIDNLRSQAKKEQAAEKKARLQKQVSGHSPILARSLPWPLKGKITTRFGRQENSAPGTPLLSNGIVIEAAEAQPPVKVVADGKVLYAGSFMSYGSMVVVEHAGDWYSVYGQLLKWNVEKGQDMKKGDTIGLAQPRGGNSRLYFELRFYGKPVDPLPWLAR